jgi:hypothetical protein
MTPTIAYTLVAYTDAPGGCLLFKKDISSPITLKVDTPPSFGHIKIDLIASLVGLDGKRKRTLRVVYNFTQLTLHQTVWS